MKLSSSLVSLNILYYYSTKNVNKYRLLLLNNLKKYKPSASIKRIIAIKAISVGINY